MVCSFKHNRWRDIWTYPGDWIEEVDNWCFDRNRAVGDVAIIENVYGYTIVYFAGAVEINN